MIVWSEVMIAVDSSEPERVLPGHLVSSALEELTGADILISPLDIPFAPGLLQEHIKAGAILVQRKQGMDLVASIGERLASSQARMLSLGVRPFQCCLLFVGSLGFKQDGWTASMNGLDVPLKGESYTILLGVFSKWILRGGVVETIARPAALDKWVSMKEAQLKDLRANPVHEVYKSPPPLLEVSPDPFQELRLVKDWRVTLASLPSLGQKRIDALLATMKEAEAEISLISALLWLLDPEKVARVPGLPHNTSSKVRAYFGLDEDIQVSLHYDD